MGQEHPARFRPSDDQLALLCLAKPAGCAITSLAGYAAIENRCPKAWPERVQGWIVDGPTEKRESHDWTAGLTG
jgi:hypothetical protein